MVSEPCMYCERGKELLEQMLPAVQLSCSDLYLFREQTYPGRCILVFREHKHKLTDLTEDEYIRFSIDARRSAQIINEVFHPDKINYLILGDLCPHLHLHLVPKYKDKKDWGKTFEMFPDPAVYTSEEKLQKLIQRMQ